MIAKSTLFEQYCVIEEIIDELNRILLHHLQSSPHCPFIPNSSFIAHVIMVHSMMQYFIQAIEEKDWLEEFYSLYHRTRKHLFTTEMMLEDLIS
ncbi:hypothetical protein [Ammoniphilus sp. YIM 78166]|uniref:hypothetical protein n=1 Tax=Ammoniphilus sp. YIM 78166 TaxID=1644106 RepID=UPI00106FCDFC|nr:hypothetical protein [Ammoniphilus sp. YIM 78166]